MGMVKRYLEEISVEMGYDGEITDEVLTEGERRMSAAPAPQAAAAAAGDESQLGKIKAAVKEFEATQAKYSKYGARDTEPDGVFQSLMVRAFKGKVGNCMIAAWIVPLLPLPCTMPPARWLT